MGPVTARLLDEFGDDPDDPDGPGGAPGPGGVNCSVIPNGSYGPNHSVKPNSWYAQRAARPALADVDAAAVPVGTILRAREGTRAVAVARLGSGRLVVVDDVCPHDGGQISDGFVEGERLVCARHGWELEVEGARCRRALPCKLRE